jgi:alkanesulfonate monooxygenase SsuD/methylene tetrahydromethanopterin reductase-like flavin-dependent oxidoreductase (luciferase family)
MNKRMYFNAFQMNCVVHMSPGLWVRADDHTVDYTSLAHWTKVAQLLERGCFDAMFLADVLGPYDVYGAAACRRAIGLARCARNCSRGACRRPW